MQIKPRGVEDEWVSSVNVAFTLISPAVLQRRRSAEINMEQRNRRSPSWTSTDRPGGFAEPTSRKTSFLLEPRPILLT